MKLLIVKLNSYCVYETFSTEHLKQFNSFLVLFHDCPQLRQSDAVVKTDTHFIENKPAEVVTQHIVKLVIFFCQLSISFETFVYELKNFFIAEFSIAVRIDYFEKPVNLFIETIWLEFRNQRDKRFERQKF